MTNCFQPFDVTSIDFQAAINVPLFHEIIEKLRYDWQSVDREHNAIQLMMQRHHDYLLYLLMSKEGHLYRVLIGSLNYFYANIISLMLAEMNSDGAGLAEKLGVAIGILEQFFDDAKSIYADALERHDTAYFVGLSVFK